MEESLNVGELVETHRYTQVANDLDEVKRLGFASLLLEPLTTGILLSESEESLEFYGDVTVRVFEVLTSHGIVVSMRGAWSRFSYVDR